MNEEALETVGGIQNDHYKFQVMEVFCYRGSVKIKTNIKHCICIRANAERKIESTWDSAPHCM